MRWYDEPIEVKRGRWPRTLPEHGAQMSVDEDALDAPAHFLWRGRLWRVSAVVTHWVETVAWWATPTAKRAGGVGVEAAPEEFTPLDLSAERETWRVEAAQQPHQVPGVFDLTFDWSAGTWRLARCWD